jgi:hypothetical protein
VLHQQESLQFALQLAFQSTDRFGFCAGVITVPDEYQQDFRAELALRTGLIHDNRVARFQVQRS